jgi:hypothetical protein
MSNRRDALVVGLVITAVVVVGVLAPLLAPRADTSSDPTRPPVVDCSYASQPEAATLVVQRDWYTDEAFEEVWVFVDERPATLRRGERRYGEWNETDPHTTTTGLWVHDGNVTDVADYPIDPGASVTVLDVEPTQRLWIRLVREESDAVTVGFEADPVSQDCSLSRN